MRLRLLAPVLLAAACSGGGGDDTTPDRPVLDGGRLAIEGCGYDVVTRLYAEAPEPGGDVVGADPAPFQVHLGLGGDPSSSIAILWRTDEETTATTVRYGVAGGALDRTVDGVTFRYASEIGGGGALIRMHETHLCGLEPDTQYEYQVGGGDTFSETFTFRTAPDIVANPDAEVVVAYVGDSRGGYDVFERVAGEVAERAPDLIVFTGDTVTIGQAQVEWDDFFGAAPELFTSTPIVAAHGNHEINAIHYYSQLAMPGDEQSFSLDFAHLHQTVVNSDPENVGEIEGSIADFLEDDLAGTDARWKILSMHRSIWSSSTNHGSDDTLREAWGPSIDAHHVDVVISGHDHIFERTRPINGEVAGDDFATGTVYMVSGGAGAPLYNVTDPLPDYSVVAESTYNGTVISVRRDMITVESFRDDGSLLDTFTITKP